MDTNPLPEPTSGASTRPSRLLAWERRLMLAAELFSAACVLAEIIILLVGVLARYVFLHPLIWTDELAQAVFLWLGMFGASVALYRGEHMRMTALLTSAGPRLRAALDIYGAAAALVFLAVVLQPSLDYVAE